MTLRVTRSGVVDAPVADVWRLLRDFNAHEGWHPAVAASAVENGDPADLVGAVRVFRLADGGVLREQLIAMSDRDMSLTYCLLEAPLPLYGYVATMRLRPVTDRDATFLVWESRFDAPMQDRDRLTRLVAQDIYEAGISALQARFGGRGLLAPRVALKTARDAPFARAKGAVIPGRAIGANPEPMNVGGAAGFKNGGSSSAPAGMFMGPGSPLRSARDDGAQAGERRYESPSRAAEALAIVVDRHGGPEVLRVGRVRVEAPGPGEVLVRHRAIGVNMVDVHGRAGDFGLAPLPAVPGMEAAGEVLDVGPGVTAFRPRDRVVYAGAPPGAYAEIRTMPAAMLDRLPDDIDDDVGAAVFLKGLMADALVSDVHPIRPGETVLVHAAAGGLGLLLCGWARALGASVIGVVSSAEKAEAARRAGCAAVVGPQRGDLLAAVREITAGRGTDVVFDGVGRTSFDVSVDALARRGHLVSYGQTSGPVGTRSIDALAAGSVRLSRPNLAHFIEDPGERQARAARLFAAIREGMVRPVIDSRLPLDEAAEAHRRLEGRRNIGAIVLIP